MRQQALRPIDIVVALRLALVPNERYESLGRVLGISLSTAHEAVRRLTQAGLLRPGSREANAGALLEFLSHGLRYAFFAELGPEARGVPTAHSAPPLDQEIVSDDTYVWPAARGPIRGTTLLPLYKGATHLVDGAPRLYRALALADAVRVGRARERKLAIEHLEQLLGSPDPPA
ncbi:MAG: hypothetical protein ACE5HQ_08905 [Gemmatimonadota bacterium]